MLKKINNLIENVKRNSVTHGTVHPEPLKYRPEYSRKIDEANCLMYDIDKMQNIKIIFCKGHYED